MKILIACECSQIVTEAFLKRGHDVMSCDLKPGKKGLPHYQGDVFDIINDGWDMMIAFPPCTDLSISGARYWKEKQKDGRQQRAFEFVKELYNSDISMVCIENPVGIMNKIWRAPDLITQPYLFGELYSKRTCFWLKNLPPLLYTMPTKPIGAWVSAGSYYRDRKKNSTRPKLIIKEHGQEQKSNTFPGIAAAMANQWG